MVKKNLYIEINNYFLHFTNENDAIDSIIKNLNENDKEIEILDENNIKLTVQINEEGGTNVDFILPKLSYEIEGEEEQIDRLRNIDNGMNVTLAFIISDDSFFRTIECETFALCSLTKFRNVVKTKNHIL